MNLMEDVVQMKKKLHVLFESSLLKRKEIPNEILVEGIYDNRAMAINWMHNILDFDADLDARDTIVQIFDRISFALMEEEEKRLRNSRFVYIMAAACVLIGTKMHDSRGFYGNKNCIYLYFMMS